MVLRPRNGLSLCAGGGGLDMGLMLAEPGFHTRCWVEWEEYPRSVIVAAQRAGYFAPAPIWDDLTTFDARPFAGCIDTLLAGYPCQPFSHAGQRKGADDERHLWPEVARVARELGPSLEWLILENVAGHVTLGLETVLRDLWDMDFTPAVGLFTAAETGAPHERERVFIVAHRQSIGAGELDHTTSTRCAEEGIGADERCNQLKRRQPLFGDGCGDLGNATGLDRRIHARSRREGGRTADAGGTGGTMADTSGARLEGQQPGQRDPCGRKEPHGLAGLSRRAWVHPPGPADMGRWADVLSVAPYLAPSLSISDVKRAADHFAQMVARGELAETQAQSFVRLCADGMANRSRALRLLGNGVHPLAAGHAWRTLSAAHGLRPLDLVAAEGGHSNRANVISMIEAAE
jgi:DNA (cytosine-5)-methyltransferase 1